MSYATATKPCAVSKRVQTPLPDAPAFDGPAFDAAEFDELSEMIGEDGAMEMVMIFENETRLRLRRLAEGDQTTAALLREMHTLKGAAGTVAAPCLTALGRLFEQSAERGIPPGPRDIETIGAALEAWLAEVRVWSSRHASVG